MNIALATINLEVADPQHTKSFYIDILGMTENTQRSHAPDFVYLESSRGSLTLAKPHGDARAQPSPTMELGFEVDDMTAFRQRLSDRRITGFRAQSMGWGEALEGTDPDGHRIIVYQFAGG